MSNFLGTREALRGDLAVTLVIEREQGFALGKFKAA